MLDKITDIVSPLLESLKEQPLVLALLLFNTIFIGAVMFRAHHIETAYHSQISTLIEKCLPH